MARTLDVYLHTDLVGHLTQDDDGDMSFQYADSWLQRTGAVPLSHSLPLRPERFRRKECRGFFAGILPEESKREIIARNLGISARNDYAMLERIGGECAGAVTFLPHGESMPDRHYGYRDLSDEELAAILKELPRRPLLAGEEGIRLSLAGAQDKLAIRLEGRTISLPLGGAPSTHILKPNVERFEGVVFNEAFCMRLAAAAGLPAAAIETHEIGGISFLWSNATTVIIGAYQKERRWSSGCTRKTSAKHFQRGSVRDTRLRRPVFRRRWHDIAITGFVSGAVTVSAAGLFLVIFRRSRYACGRRQGRPCCRVDPALFQRRAMVTAASVPVGSGTWRICSLSEPENVTACCPLTEMA
jgi:HipA-like protein